MLWKVGRPITAGCGPWQICRPLTGTGSGNRSCTLGFSGDLVAAAISRALSAATVPDIVVLLSLGQGHVVMPQRNAAQKVTAADYL